MIFELPSVEEYPDAVHHRPETLLLLEHHQKRFLFLKHRQVHRGSEKIRFDMKLATGGLRGNGSDVITQRQFALLVQGGIIEDRGEVVRLVITV